ncbi:MAG: endo-1,4-beta-xylanase [Acidimicrobiia bacterium]|nr:endo-1,4-beta-xylanase [Acidimicrobiia bacterium]
MLVGAIAGLRSRFAREGPLHEARQAKREAAVASRGVGMQFHAAPGVHDIDFAGVADQMQAVRALGLDYAITEYDYALTLPASQADLEEQGKVTRRLAETCLAAPNCRTFIGWGFTDRHSWVPSVFPDRGKATLFDEQLRRKPAFGGLLTALRAAARQPPVPE